MRDARRIANRLRDLVSIFTPQDVQLHANARDGQLHCWFSWIGAYDGGPRETVYRTIDFTDAGESFEAFKQSIDDDVEAAIAALVEAATDDLRCAAGDDVP